MGVMNTKRERCIYIYIHMHPSTWINEHAFIYLSICTLCKGMNKLKLSIYIHTYDIHIYIYTYVHIHTDIYICIRIHTCICVYICIYVYVHLRSELHRLSGRLDANEARIAKLVGAPDGQGPPGCI